MPSLANPADMLSREGKAPFPPTSGEVDRMRIPVWADQKSYSDIGKILDTMTQQGLVSMPDTPLEISREF